MNWIAVLSVAVCAGSSLCFGQAETPLERLRALHLPTAAGNVPVVYSRAEMARAERYRSAVESAHRWYESQLEMRVPVTLAVLNRQDWERATPVPYPMPNSKPGLVTLPSRMEDFPGFPEMGIDADILAETISFHELGHLFAYRAGVRSENLWLNELVANLFAQSYILAHQPDLKAYRSSPVSATLRPRYTSLDDLNYLSSDMPFSNYAWFQFQLNRLAAFVSQQRDLSTIVRQLKADFPSAALHLTTREVFQRMEGMAAGFTNQLGPLLGPTTLPAAHEFQCDHARPAEGAPSFLVIDNQTSEEIVVSRAGKEPARVGVSQWQRMKVVAGEQLRLSTGGCLLASDEPTVIVIQKAK